MSGRGPAHLPKHKKGKSATVETFRLQVTRFCNGCCAFRLTHLTTGCSTSDWRLYFLLHNSLVLFLLLVLGVFIIKLRASSRWNGCDKVGGRGHKLYELKRPEP
jgi:hypothetical protein